MSDSQEFTRPNDVFPDEEQLMLDKITFLGMLNCLKVNFNSFNNKSMSELCTLTNCFFACILYKLIKIK
jgi:hypothetical protein